MKKLFFGIATACCTLYASAAPVEDFIGTWKLERTTAPNYIVIKRDGERLVALRYARNVLTGKIVERRYAASYAHGDVTIASGATAIEARSVNDVVTVTMLAQAYKKMSSSTAPPTSEGMSQT